MSFPNSEHLRPLASRRFIVAVITFLFLAIFSLWIRNYEEIDPATSHTLTRINRDFLKLCHEADTDKCHGAHTYQYGYSKYLTNLRNQKVRMFEIGLGCGQSNLGASFRLWTKFFPQLVLHIMEYNQVCAKKWYAELSAADKQKVTLHCGDQSNKADLLRVMQQTKIPLFDVIVDDVGHGMTQQQVSLAVLFPFVAPGGVYFVGGLHTSYTSFEDQPTTTDAFKSMLDWMHGDPRLTLESNRHGLLKIMKDVEHMDCYPEMCVFQKFALADLASEYLIRPIIGTVTNVTLPDCSPGKGLESRGFVYRSRLQNQGEIKSYANRGFLELCHNANTDKCHGAHTYQYGYSKYLTNLRNQKVRMFEIGLGCGQSNLGASFRLWTKFFPQLVLHIMEYNQVCAKKWYAELSAADKQKVTLHYGDQGNKADLLRVMKETKIPLFDVIVDDGGHGMTQQQVSLTMLFPFVKPGGILFMEDLLTSYVMHEDQPTTTDAINSMLDWMHGDPRLTLESNRHGLLKIMKDVEHMDCYPEMCVFQKFALADLASEYLIRPIIGTTSNVTVNVTLPKCSPSKGLESRGFVYRSRLQNKGEVSYA